uniref:Uncharacterized protein n=1 Tax=Timema genevievae TaxID=629358 RepID=A0A7R9PMZ5_TIMGE|nr:unnamed protein product [Timema genevievae]
MYRSKSSRRGANQRKGKRTVQAGSQIPISDDNRRRQSEDWGSHSKRWKTGSETPPALSVMELSCEEAMGILIATENVSLKLKPVKRGTHEINQLRESYDNLRTCAIVCLHCEDSRYEQRDISRAGLTPTSAGSRNLTTGLYCALTLSLGHLMQILGLW